MQLASLLGCLLRFTLAEVAAGGFSSSAGGGAQAVDCDLAIVGAGVGGAYAAWGASAAGRKVCVFERSFRPGGRIHSLRGKGPQKDLVVEAGAYRFAPKPVCIPFENTTRCIKTPITAAAVEKLELRSAVYNPDPTQWDHGMRKIVDPTTGHDAGYLTLVEAMLSAAQRRGAVVSFNTTVVQLDTIGDNSTYPIVLSVASHFSGGELVVGAVSARAVILNLPQMPLLSLLRSSSAPFSTMYPAALYAMVAYPIMKLYVYYDDAWWRNVLQLVAGPFTNNQPGNATFTEPWMNPLLQSPVPLRGQYHDGDVRCDLPGGACRGYLQAFYYTGPAVQYFATYVSSISQDSVTELSWERPEQRELLELVHEALVEMHKPPLEKAGAFENVTAMRPRSAVLSIWSQGVVGINCGCHFPKQGSHPKPGDVPELALQPFSGLPVYVANEAFGPVQCFAEGSLNMSHAALQLQGIKAPVQDLLHQGADGAAAAAAFHSSPPTDPFLLSAEAWQQVRPTLADIRPDIRV